MILIKIVFFPTLPNKSYASMAKMTAVLRRTSRAIRATIQQRHASISRSSTATISPMMSAGVPRAGSMTTIGVRP